MKREGNRTKEVKLYNVLFPIWFLMLYPITWLLVIPGNFIIDSLVLLLGMYLLKIDEKKDFYKNNILKVFLFGFLADLIGSLFLLLTYAFGENEWWYEYILAPVSENPYDNVYALLYTCMAVVISGVLIYVFNRFISFRKVKEISKRRILSLILAIMTTPYLFLIPTSGVTGNMKETFTNHFVWQEYTMAEVYLSDNSEVDILEKEVGKNYNFGVSLSLRDGINTAKKTKKTELNEWKYKVVFYKNVAERKAMDEILIYEVSDKLYFTQNGKCYIINDENSKEITDSIESHLTLKEDNLQTEEKADQ